ncbi:MAG: DUF4212 domain-containing protein [Pseudomonadota bacterium]
MDELERTEAYWKANLQLVAKLLVIWFVVSFLCGVVFVDELNHLRLGGYKLGFWFAQQGSIFTFVALVFYYARRMNELDRKFSGSEGVGNGSSDGNSKDSAGKN